MLKRLGIVFGLLLAFSTQAFPQAKVITSCGTIPASFATLAAGAQSGYWMDINGNLCVGASVSISGFAPGAFGTPISVTTGGVSGTLPTGAVVVATNVGTTNGAYCALGASATTASQYIAPNGGWFAFTVGGSTQLTCITSTSTTTVNMTGGSGLPTGTGGGGGGSGGGGVVTQPNASLLNMTEASAASILTAINNGSATNGTTYPASSVSVGWKDGSGNIQPAAVATPFPIQSVSQYPVGAVPITASQVGTTVATTATLAGTAGKTTYICWYSIRANAAATSTVTNTITGVITATLSSLMWIAPAASGIGVDEQIFSPCIPASATNTPIAIVSGTPGASGNVTVKGGGYQL